MPQARLQEVAAAMSPSGSAMFANTLIEQRYLSMPLEWYLGTHGFRARNDAYLEVGLELAAAAARDAIQEADLAPADVDAILFVSSTGIATPSLDARLAARLGCRPDVVRMPLWGLGCAGGVAGLNRAAEWTRGRPDGHVLLVCLELCTLSFHPSVATGQADKKTLVAASIFGDGCAAMVVSGDGTGAVGPRHLAGAAHLFEDTERVMGWDVEDTHMEVVLSPSIPAIVAREMRGLVDRFLEGRAPSRWVLHPGGARVIAAYQEALGLDDQALEDTSRTMALHGNMSSPTVLFVLQRALRTPLAPGERALLAALGPGFASELALVQG